MHPELFTIPGLNLAVPSYGALLVAGFLSGIWWATRRATRVKADPDLILNLGFIILFFSMVGARAFYVIHHWDSQFAGHPKQILNLRAGGFEFYGGFIAAFVAAAGYLWYKRASLRLYVDIVAPSIMPGMGVARIGCFLFGCCWGGPCPAGLPWAVRFPCASPAHQRQWEHRLVTLPAELILVGPNGEATPLPRQIFKLASEDLEPALDKATSALEEAKAGGDSERINQAQHRLEQVQEAIASIQGHFEAFDVEPAALRELTHRPEYGSTPVHPAQLYASIGGLLLAWLTNAYFYRRRRHGTVMVLALMLYAVQRFVEEIIRIDNPRDTLGLTISQGIGVVIFVTALVLLFIVRQLPLRSPRLGTIAQPVCPTSGRRAGTRGPAVR